MLLLTLTSNNTYWCAHMMSPSDQLSSYIDSSLSHLQLQQVTSVSLFQPQWEQASWTQIIQYHLCSCLDKISCCTSLHLTTACCSWMFHSQTRRLCSWGSCSACQVAASRYAQAHLLCSWCSKHAYQEAAGRTSQVRPVLAIVATSSHSCGAASCSCEPELPSGTTVPTQDWTPLWHGFGSSLWRKSLLLRARSCHLVPLY